MSEIIDIEDSISENEGEKMGSVNHSIAQGRIAGLLFNDGRFTVMPELSLDMSQIELSQFGLNAKKRT